jgi:signal transduction histidine kinase
VVKILIVEDEISNRKLLEVYLKKAGFKELLFAGSADEAFSILRLDDPECKVGKASDVDLILMDIVMPNIDGIEATDIIRKIPHLRDIPIVMVTATDKDETLQPAFEAGAIDFIRKPIDKTELIARVRSVLRLKHEMDQRKLAEEEANASRDRAESATKLKDKFISLVSHDLRGPIAGVRNSLEVIFNPDEYDFDEKTKKEMVKDVIQVSDRLIAMIDELLDVSRFQTGKIKLSKSQFDAEKAVSDTISNLSPLAVKKGVTLKNELPKEMKLFADQALIGEVITNLVSNSIKFCTKGESVRLFIPAKSPSTIAVKDNGAGIPKSFLPDLFRHEVKTSTIGTEGEKGTGLGLPYCREIMEAHGGSLTVESTEGKGSTFYARLPRKQE